MYKTIIFHSPLAKGASADELDVLQEADFFSKGLTQLGYKAIILPFDYDLKRLMEVVRKIKPDFAVNLVETLFTSGKLVHIAPFMLEHFNIPFTGCSGHAMYLSSHKVLSKQHMLANHINTPEFFSFSSLKEVSQYTIQKPFLIKSVWEHASYGMDESLPLLFNNKVELLNQVTNKTQPENYFC